MDYSKTEIAYIDNQNRQDQVIQFPKLGIQAIRNVNDKVFTLFQNDTEQTIEIDYDTATLFAMAVLESASRFDPKFKGKKVQLTIQVCTQ